MSQKDRLLARLKAGQLCAMEPLDWEPRIYRVAARILELRGAGHDIITEDCWIHEGGHAVYRLVAQEQMELFA